MSLDSIEQELLQTLRSVETELRGVKEQQQSQQEQIFQLRKNMQDGINNISYWVRDVQDAQRTQASRSMRPVWGLVVCAGLALALFAMLGVGLLVQGEQRNAQERQGLPMIIVTATPSRPADGGAP